MTAERVLHVPVWLPHARLPVEPGSPHQFPEQPTIDVAAIVMSDIYDEALSIEDRIKLFGPLSDIIGAHGAQMHVSELPLPLLLHFEAPRILP